jgi:hypothetical protein
MNSKTKQILVTFSLLLLTVPGLAFAQSQSGFSLVPCGGEGQNACTFNDLIVILIRLINLLLAAAGIVAIYYVMMAAWDMVSGLGNPEKITKGKTALRHAVVGFAIILLSFAFINLLLGLLGITCPWWENLSCIIGYNYTSNGSATGTANLPPAPLNPPPPLPNPP